MHQSAWESFLHLLLHTAPPEQIQLVCISTHKWSCKMNLGSFARKCAGALSPTVMLRLRFLPASERQNDWTGVFLFLVRKFTEDQNTSRLLPDAEIKQVQQFGGFEFFLFFRTSPDPVTCYTQTKPRPPWCAPPLQPAELCRHRLLHAVKWIVDIKS